MTEELLVQACIHNSLCYEELSWKLHLKYVSVAFRRISRNSTYSDMLHTCYWISANKSSSIDIMSVALIFQAAAELLLSWRAHTAGLSISDATIRMKRQYRNMQRTATEKGEQEKILKKNKLKKKKKCVFTFFSLRVWVELRTVGIIERLPCNYFSTSESTAGTPWMPWIEGKTQSKELHWKRRPCNHCRYRSALKVLRWWR